MKILAVLAGILLTGVTISDMFETVILPRTVTRRVRLARYFYRITWSLSRRLARVLPWQAGRDFVLVAFGPLSLPALLALWAFFLMLGFALIYWGAGLRLTAPTLQPGFGAYLYWSGATFLTLSFGDVVPAEPLARTLGVLEGGVGFGFLAIVIGYLPVIYQSFSRREVGISLLDSRAGSPPTAGELLRRFSAGGRTSAVTPLLHDFERWSADLLESHLSYPVLVYYRSQHDRVSWLGAITAVLDACALILAGLKEETDWQRDLRWQAHHTFAMARHAVIDLALILRAPPAGREVQRLSPAEMLLLQERLTGSEWQLTNTSAETALRTRCGDYEPYVQALAQRLALDLPAWTPPAEARDNWQTSAWELQDHF